MSATAASGKGNSPGSAAPRYEATGASKATDTLGDVRGTGEAAHRCGTQGSGRRSRTLDRTPSSLIAMWRHLPEAGGHQMPVRPKSSGSPQ